MCLVALELFFDLLYGSHIPSRLVYTQLPLNSQTLTLSNLNLISGFKYIAEYALDSEYRNVHLRTAHKTLERLLFKR